VRINPTTVNNVVTYDVVVDVNNTTGQLLPGMTANATIVVASAPNALVVPLATVHAALRGTSGAPQGDTASAANPWGGSTSGSSSVISGESATIMVQRNGKIQRVPVQVGLVTTTQAAVTPINGATLAAGDKVVTSMSGGSHKGSYQGKAQGQAASTNPLAGGSTASRSATRGLP
jgi:HlyD family secretion protein